MNILVINAGSSSIKYKVYEQSNLLLSGIIEGIYEKSGRWHHQSFSETAVFRTHQDAFAAIASRLKHDLKGYPLHGVGHRVVHGGVIFYQPTVITTSVLTAIKSLAKLAPLHNPANAAGIDYAQLHFPEALHVAIFDSSFHHTLPAHIKNYALNSEIAAQYQIRRYGFHGINHEYVAQQAALFINKPLLTCNFISLHLGNGASACLIKNGQSYDTTMGMTPLAGLVMGTRCGDIDPAIALYLLKEGLTIDLIDAIFNKESGLKGIANDNDMRAILARAANNDEEAKLALAMYNYAIQKIIGAYLSQLTTVDALIFTGGVGENAAIVRREILTTLKHFNFFIDDKLNQQTNSDHCRSISTKGIPILVIKADEESFIAKQVSLQLQ